MTTGKLHDLPEAARLLGGISVWTLRRWITLGDVNVVRLGRRVFLRTEEIERICRKGLPSLRSGAGGKAIDEQDSTLMEEKVCLTK
jgi:hypothetical protein